MTTALGYKVPGNIWLQPFTLLEIYLHRTVVPLLMQLWLLQKNKPHSLT